MTKIDIKSYRLYGGAIRAKNVDDSMARRETKCKNKMNQVIGWMLLLQLSSLLPLSLCACVCLHPFFYTLMYQKILKNEINSNNNRRECVSQCVGCLLAWLVRWVHQLCQYFISFRFGFSVFYSKSDHELSFSYIPCFTYYITHINMLYVHRFLKTKASPSFYTQAHIVVLNI